MAIGNAVPRVALSALVVALSQLLTACGDELPGRGPPRGLPAVTTLGEVPLGDVAGAATGPLHVAASIANPYAGDPRARREGEGLFVSMNCAGCHGHDVEGGMGPSLVDDDWRYGGLPAQVFNSIYEGRPQGMPAYGRMLAPESIWRIVTYLESLEGLLGRREVLAALGEGQRRGGPTQRTMKGRQNAGRR